MSGAILTHATEPRGGRLVQCCRCREVWKCTPRRDVYVRAGESGPTAALWCMQCLAATAVRCGR